jgi:hypothetical protein
MPRARTLAPALLIAAIVAAGCAESPEQHSARLAVERAAGTSGRGGETSCTPNPRLFFTTGPTAKVFVCVVKVGGGLCDRYFVHRSGGNYAVRLQERDGDCILPTT